MSAPVINPSGDQTPHRLLVTDINMTSPLAPLAPNWQTLQYVEDNDFNPDDAVMAESGVFGDAGWGNQDVMGATWHATITLNHMIVPGTVTYDPTHDFLEQNAIGAFGPKRRAQLRFYDYDLNDTSGLYTPRGQAYMGYATYTWPGYGGGSTNDKRLVAVAFQGKGPLYKITHPYPLAPSAPVQTAVDPDTIPAAGGVSFRILGRGFARQTVTAVSFGGTAATSFRVLSDSEIIGVAPAHATGTGLPVVVTNATGASTGGDTVIYV